MGLSWTVRGMDQEWLMAKVPRYNELRAQGKGARSKNVARDAYVRAVVEEYGNTFPGRLEAMDLSKIRTGGSKEERAIAIHTRFDDFFGNQLRTPASGVGGKRDAINLSEKGGKRLEQSINCYFRLYKDVLRPALDQAYADHRKECNTAGSKALSFTTFKNRFLSERLKTEPEDVRDRILMMRKTGTERDNEDLIWNDADRIDDTELERRRMAYTMNSDITKSIYTLERAGRRIHELTGWNVMWAMCGPDPKRGGEMHTKWSTEGATLPNDAEPDGLEFENWYGNWSGMLESFEEFSKESTTKDYRVSLSLDYKKLVKGAKGRNESVQKIEEPKGITGLTDVEDIKSIREDDDLIDPQLKELTNKSPDIPAATLTPAPPAVVPTVAVAVCSPEPEANPTTVVSSNTPASTIPVLKDSTKPSLQSTPDDEKNIQLIALPVHRPPLANRTNLESHQIDKRSRSTRSNAVPAKPKDSEDDIPPKAIWLEDALTYVRGALKGVGCLEADKLLDLYLKLERMLDFPLSKSKANHIPGIRPPALVTWTAKRQRDLWFTPPEIFPPNEFIKSTGNWWRSLQPLCRNADIKHDFYFGGRIRPDNATDWEPLRRAGPNGLFLVIMALSWMPESIASLVPTSHAHTECSAIFEALLCDVEWVLEAILAQGLTTVASEPAAKSIPPPSARKRKAEESTVLSEVKSAKKSRKSAK